MAKYLNNNIGRVTYTNGNGETVEFVPEKVELTKPVPDRYFSVDGDTVCSVPYNSISISIEGVYQYSDAYPTGNAYDSMSDNNYGYSLKIGDCPHMKLSMNWLKPEQLQHNDFGPGMLFLYENRASFFGSEPEVMDNLVALVINGNLPRTLDLADYQGGLLVQGFDVPKVDHPLLNIPLKPAIHHRGTVEQNNPRTIYEYMSDETYGLGLYVGLTVHDVLGSWSSWPVHEYEINALTAPLALYPDFNEKFAFITNPMGSWGLQARAQANGNKSVLMFRDADIIDIPLGAHPNVAAPATRLAYFWAYMGAPRKDF